MQIDLNLANNQAQQIRTHSDNLCNARVLLRSFQEELRRNWRGPEMVGINNAINSILNRLVSSSTELDAIAADINHAAQEVRRRQEELEMAAAERGCPKWRR